MLTAVPPVLVSVTVADFVVPSVTLPKASLDGLSESVPGATPVPVSDIVSVGFDAFELIVTVPLALPVACGANVTVKVVFWDGFNVRGVAIPLNVNPVPVMLACDTLTAVPPVLVRVTVADWVVPVVTLPKASLVGLSESAPGVTPVPDKGISRDGFEAVEVTVTVPLTLPALVGANLTDSEAVCPADNVTGVVMPLTVNPVPLAET